MDTQLANNQPWKCSAKSLHRSRIIIRSLDNLWRKGLEIASFDQQKTNRRKVSVRNVLYYIFSNCEEDIIHRRNRLKRSPPPVPPTDIERNRDSVTDTIWHEWKVAEESIKEYLPPHWPQMMARYRETCSSPRRRCTSTMTRLMALWRILFSFFFTTNIYIFIDFGFETREEILFD